jgi:dTMP kinase
MKRGLFVTVEGTDGSGKTTQIKLMEAYLIEKGFEVVLIREPGGTRISEEIRSMILDPKNTEMGRITEMLLYASSRAQLVYQIIKPSIESGKIVICDRFVDSSYAYQGFGRGIDFKTIEAINKAAIDGIEPNITFFFDIDPETAIKRRIETTGADRIENEKIDFHIRVYDGYKELALLYSERIKSIDSKKSVEDIGKDVRGHLDRLIESSTL